MKPYSGITLIIEKESLNDAHHEKISQYPITIKFKYPDITTFCCIYFYNKLWTLNINQLEWILCGL